MQERVAVVESTLHHGARHSFSSLFRYNIPNVTERLEMKACRLTDGVDVFLERESVIQSDTQTLNTVRRQHSHIAQVNRSDVRLCNLQGARAYYNGFSFIRIEGKSVQIEPVVQSTEAVTQHLSGVGVIESAK